ncbi:MAG: hypothetical protein ACKVRN_01590 [Pyrinomonadaceae bacterium]
MEKRSSGSAKHSKNCLNQSVNSAEAEVTKEWEVIPVNTKRDIYKGEPTPMKRLAITVIAIVAVLAVVIITAKLFGEFTWHIL